MVSSVMSLQSIYMTSVNKLFCNNNQSHRISVLGFSHNLGIPSNGPDFSSRSSVTPKNNRITSRPISQNLGKTGNSRPNATSDDLSRRSGNYQPSPWDHHYLLSMENNYAREKEGIRTRDVLMKKVKRILDDETKSRLEQLELIDDLQKLGVSYHFELEINKMLTDFHLTNERNLSKCDKEEDLHETALEFRLLRQHGFDVSEDIFDVIIDKMTSNTFKSDDIKSRISLYEASFLSTKSDTKLRKVIRPLATEQIRKLVENETCNIEERENAIHALEMPYYWRMKRLETRWYIDAYEKKHGRNLALIQFAKIDFNIVQSAHQEDLKYVSSWWKDTCLANELPFIRDRIVENYFWTVGLICEPQFGYIRRIMTKVNALVTTIDDIYDIYGSIEELELFTFMVEKWDINRIEELPEYMRLCYLILYNEINAIGYDILKYKNIDVIYFLKKSWADLCKRYLVEAQWYKEGYKPSLEEYMRNAWISVSVSTVLIHFYCLVSDKISVQNLETLSQHRQHIVRYSATIFRLANDLETSDELARGDVLKSVQCYMHETGASEEESREHVQQMITNTWDDMNYETKTSSSSSSFSRGVMEAAMNLARMSQFVYQYGDGYRCPHKVKTVGRVQTVLFDPIPLD